MGDKNIVQTLLEKETLRNSYPSVLFEIGS